MEPYVLGSAVRACTTRLRFHDVADVRIQYAYEVLVIVFKYF